MTDINIQIKDAKNEIWTLKDFIEWYFQSFLGWDRYSRHDVSFVKQKIGTISKGTIIFKDDLAKYIYDKLKTVQPKRRIHPPIR